MAKQKEAVKDGKADKTITIPPISGQLIRITIKGLTPILMNKFSDEARDELAATLTGQPKSSRKNIVPKQEWEAHTHYMKVNGKTQVGFPSIAFKKAVVRAAKYLKGMTMTDMRTLFQIRSDELVPLNFDSVEERQDRVNLGGREGSAHIAFRRQFNNWKTDLDVWFNSDQITIEQLLQLFRTAGIGIGVGSWRPEKSGTFGQFDVVSAKLIQQ